MTAAKEWARRLVRRLVAYFMALNHGRCIGWCQAVKVRGSCEEMRGRHSDIILCSKWLDHEAKFPNSCGEWPPSQAFHPLARRHPAHEPSRVGPVQCVHQADRVIQLQPRPVPYNTILFDHNTVSRERLAFTVAICQLDKAVCVKWMCILLFIYLFLTTPARPLHSQTPLNIFSTHPSGVGCTKSSYSSISFTAPPSVKSASLGW